jgi:hypothetical protein
MSVKGAPCVNESVSFLCNSSPCGIILVNMQNISGFRVFTLYVKSWLCKYDVIFAFEAAFTIKCSQLTLYLKFLESMWHLLVLFVEINGKLLTKLYICAGRTCITVVRFYGLVGSEDHLAEIFASCTALFGIWGSQYECTASTLGCLSHDARGALNGGSKGDGIIVYKHTSHSCNIQTWPYKFVADSSQLTLRKLILGPLMVQVSNQLKKGNLWASCYFRPFM